MYAYVLVIDLCTPNPCTNKGVCTNYKTAFSCACSSSFTGLTCQKGTTLFTCQKGRILFTCQKGTTLYLYYFYDYTLRDYINCTTVGLVVNKTGQPEGYFRPDRRVHGDTAGVLEPDENKMK